MHSVRIHRMWLTMSQQISTGSASAKSTDVNKATSTKANASTITFQAEEETKTHNTDTTRRKNSSMRHRERHSEDVYSCNECEKCFLSLSSLNQHALTHRITQKCTECGRSFRGKKALFMHSLRIHRICQTTSQQISAGRASAKSSDNAATNTSTLQAEAETKADKTDISGRKDSVERHREVVRSDDNVYSCDECEKCFSSQASLNQHVLIHRIGQKCTECGRSFHSKNALLMHSVRIHRMRQPMLQQISTCLLYTSPSPRD